MTFIKIKIDVLSYTSICVVVLLYCIVIFPYIILYIKLEKSFLVLSEKFYKQKTTTTTTTTTTLVIKKLHKHTNTATKARAL